MFNKLNEWKERIEAFRERVQTGEKKSSRWKKRWEKISSKAYVFMGVFTIAGLLFFNYSRLFFSDDSPIVDSGVGEVSKTKIGSSEVEVVSRKINNSTGYAELLLHVDESSDQVNKEYVSFAGEVKKEQPIETKLQPISEDYYLIQLRNVPKKWKVLAIDFGYNATPKAPVNVDQIEEEKQAKQNRRSQQSTFYWDARRSKSTEELKEKNTEQYVADVISLEEKETENRQKLLVTNRKNIDKEIEKIDQNVRREKQEAAYKVGQEKEDSKNKISRLENEKEKYSQAKKDIHEEQNLLKEKLKKLKERKGKLEEKSE